MNRWAMKMMKNIKFDPMPEQRYEALLIDLDGTLIELELEQFISAYFKALTVHFAELYPPEQFSGHLLRSTKTIISHREPDQTNEAVFFDDFCSRVGIDRAAIDPLLHIFYRDEFPRLRSCSASRPDARKVLEAAQRQGLKLVLATQPIFPRSAALERLSWGGLSEDYFDLITTLENMHSCKPHPEYYLEIASRIGVSPEQCLMAGNDTVEDISAAKTGMGTFLVEGGIIDRGEAALPSDYRGTLAELAAFIENDFPPAKV